MKINTHGCIWVNGIKKPEYSKRSTRHMFAIWEAAKYELAMLPQNRKNSVIVKLVNKSVKRKIKNFPASACRPNRKYAQRENRVTCIKVMGISANVK